MSGNMQDTDLDEAMRGTADYSNLPFKKQPITDQELRPDLNKPFAHLYGRDVGREHLRTISDPEDPEFCEVLIRDMNLKSRLALDHSRLIDKDVVVNEWFFPTFWPPEEYEWKLSEGVAASEEYFAALRTAVTRFRGWDLRRPIRNAFLQKAGSLGRVPKLNGSGGFHNAGGIANMCYTALSAYLSRKDELSPLFAQRQLGLFLNDVVRWATWVIENGLDRDFRDLFTALEESLEENGDSLEGLLEVISPDLRSRRYGGYYLSKTSSGDTAERGGEDCQ